MGLYVKNIICKNLNFFFFFSKNRSYIILHSKDLTVSSIKLYIEKPETEIQIQSIVKMMKREMLMIKTHRNISQGQYILKMDFTGNLTQKMTGFYLSTYFDKSIR